MLFALILSYFKVHESELRSGWRSECSPLSITLPNEVCLNGSFSGTSTPSTISPGENTTLEDGMGKVMVFNLVHLLIYSFTYSLFVSYYNFIHYRQ